MCLFVRLAWLCIIPVAEAPDENTHLWVAEFLAAHFRLPSAAEVALAAPLSVYGSLPQLGYLPHAFFICLAPADQHLLAARLGSLVCGILTSCLALRLGDGVFPGNPLARRCLAALVIFHPQLVFVNSYVNSDSTTAMLSSVILVLCVGMLRRGPALTACALGGLASAWLVLSKYSGAAVVPVFFLCLPLSAWLNGTRVLPALAMMACFIVSAAVGCLWWFARNHAEFAGDTLGTRTMYRMWASAYGRQLEFNLPVWSVLFEHRWWRFMFFSFWGLFGYMNRFIWRPLYFVYLAFSGLAALGWLAPLVKRAKWLKPDASACCFLLMAAAVAANLAAMLWSSSRNLGGPQGRYLFASELPVACLIVGGLCRLKGGRWFLLAFTAFNALVCLGSLVYLAGMYGAGGRF